MAGCWTAGVKAGIDAAMIVKVFNEAALGQVMSLKVRLPATYLGGDFEPRFSLALARKDLGLAQELGRATDTPMPLGALAARLRGDPERSSARDISLIDVNCVAAQIGTERIRFVERIPAPAANLVISIVGSCARISFKSGEKSCRLPALRVSSLTKASMAILQVRVRIASGYCDWEGSIYVRDPGYIRRS